MFNPREPPFWKWFPSNRQHLAFLLHITGINTWRSLMMIYYLRCPLCSLLNTEVFIAYKVQFRQRELEHVRHRRLSYTVVHRRHTQYTLTVYVTLKNAHSHKFSDYISCSFFNKYSFTALGLISCQATQTARMCSVAIFWPLSQNGASQEVSVRSATRHTTCSVICNGAVLTVTIALASIGRPPADTTPDLY